MPRCLKRGSDTSEEAGGAGGHPPVPLPGHRPESLDAQAFRLHQVPPRVLNVIRFSCRKTTRKLPTRNDPLCGTEPLSGTRHHPPDPGFLHIVWTRPICPTWLLDKTAPLSGLQPTAEESRMDGSLPSSGNTWGAPRGSPFGWARDAGGPCIQPRASGKPSWRRHHWISLKRDEVGPESFTRKCLSSYHPTHSLQK